MLNVPIIFSAMVANVKLVRQVIPITMAVTNHHAKMNVKLVITRVTRMVEYAPILNSVTRVSVEKVSGILTNILTTQKTMEENVKVGLPRSVYFEKNFEIKKILQSKIVWKFTAQTNESLSFWSEW